MKKYIRTVLLILSAVLIFLFAVLVSPVRAIRFSALLQGCEYRDVMTARFEKTGSVNSMTAVYKAVNTVLPDRLTVSGHSAWYVHRILFFNIAVWAGNG